MARRQLVLVAPRSAEEDVLSMPFERGGRWPVVVDNRGGYLLPEKAVVGAAILEVVPKPSTDHEAAFVVDGYVSAVKQTMYVRAHRQSVGDSVFSSQCVGLDMHRFQGWQRMLARAA